MLLTDRSDGMLEAIRGAIGRSAIVVTRLDTALPDGFGETDIAILEWIAAEGRRLGRRVVCM
jgi:hypothetical protein